MFAAHTFRRATQENEKKTANCDGRTEENRINGNFYYNEKPCDIDDRGDFIDRRAGFVLSATSDGSNSFTSSMQPKASLQDLKSFLDIPLGIRFACLFAIFPLLRFHTLTLSPSHPRPSPPNAQKRAKVEDVLPNPNTESFAGMANDPDLIALGSMAAMPNFHHHPNFGLAYGGGLVQPMMQHMSFRRGGGQSHHHGSGGHYVYGYGPAFSAMHHATANGGEAGTPGDYEDGEGEVGRRRTRPMSGMTPLVFAGMPRTNFQAAWGVPAGYDGSFHLVLQVVLTDSRAAERRRDRDDLGVARRDGPDGQRRGPAAAAQEVGEVERLLSRWGGGPVRGE
jgi:hypothetical protein